MASRLNRVQSLVKDQKADAVLFTNSWSRQDNDYMYLGHYLGTKLSQRLQCWYRVPLLQFPAAAEPILEHLLESHLKQLVQEQHSVPDSVKELHNHHKDTLTRPSCNELSTALHSVTAIYTSAFIIVDALAECTAARGFRP